MKAYIIRHPRSMRKAIAAYLSMRKKIENERKEIIKKIHKLRKKGLSTTHIARELKIYRSLVSDVMHRVHRDAKPIPMLPKRFLQRLYWKEKLSVRKIAKLLGVGQCTVIRWMDKYKIKRRGKIEAIEEANAKYKRRPFKGSPSFKAYLIGFTIGDCGASWHRRKIMVQTGSSHPAQIKLFKELFSRWISGFLEYSSGPTKFNTYCLHVCCNLDPSFEFLIKAKREIPKEVFRSRETFLSFFAGFIDAEGYIGCCNDKGRYVRFIIRVGNKNYAILKQIYEKLKSLGYNPSYVHLPKKDMWVLELSRKGEVIHLLQHLPLRHMEKSKKKQFILRNGNARFWEDIRHRWETLRNNIENDISNFCRSYAIGF